MRITIYMFAFFVLLVNVAVGQVGTVTETQVRAELEKRGISEEELLRELNARGIAVEDLENLSPSQLVELEQIVAELEARNAAEVIPEATVVDKEDFLAVPTTKETEAVKEEIKKVIEEEVGEKEPPAKIYGHSFFKDRDLSVFETSTEIKAPDNYILGAGDKIVISIFGISRAELSNEIDLEGYIEVNNRKVFLKGLTLKDAKNKLFQNLSRFYRFTQGQFNVALSYSRTINVNIQGEVSSPGGYTISAINNAYNGLIAAGGPSDIGSLRDILLIRKDGSVVNLDFYSYLKNPNSATNAYLEEGDVIVVPVARKIVSITGGVKRAMNYEMKSNESLNDLIELSGGYSSDANRSLVQVLRFATSGNRYIDVPGDQVNSFILQDGDRVRVPRIENDVNNFVTIRGAVINGGNYERTEGLAVVDLISISKLQPGARKDLAFIRRVQEDGKIIYIPISIDEGSQDLNIPLVNQDELTITNLSLINENQEFQVSGAVRTPGSYNFSLDQSISIRDAVQLAGGLRRDASGIGIVHTKDPLNPKVKQYMRVNLADAFEDPEFFVLTALDSLEIFSQTLFDERSDVAVTGAVNSPGTYQFGLGMTVGDVLTMSGGFKIGAETNKLEVYRLVIEDNKPTMTVIANLSIDRDLAEGTENLDFPLLPYDEIVVRYVPEFEFQQIVRVEGEVPYPGQYSLIKDNETVREVIMRAGGITAEAFPSAAKLIRAQGDMGVVIIKLDLVLDNPSSRFNFKLKDGDRIIIPKSKDFVTIIGATNAAKLYSQDILGEQSKLNVPFHRGKDAKFYIESYAGGVASYGSANEIYVENANGEITRTKNYFVYKNFPDVQMGSTIVVGSKPPKTKEQKEREDVDWSKVLADSVGQAVSILSLLLLIQRL